MIPKTRKEAFKVLGLSENASEQEIKKAYHKLALKWHPDKCPDKSQEKKDEATEKSKEITVAYGILMDKISEEFIRKQPNDDWVDDWHGLYLSKEERDLFDALLHEDLTKTKTLLEQVRNINAQVQPFNMWTGNSILHYIVENSCNNPESGWIELLKEVLSKYSANNSTPTHNSSIELCSQLNIIDINIWGDGGTPLHIACELGNLSVINVLLKYGADPNVHGNLKYTPLYYALKEDKIDIAKVLFEHGAKIDVGYVEEKLIIGSVTEYSQGTVEILLSHTSNRQKSRMLQAIACSDHEETDHDIEKAKLLLKAGGDPKFCGETEKGESNASALFWAEHRGKSKLVKLFNEHKENIINNSPVKKQDVQPHITDHNPPQKQSLGVSRKIIGSALLFGAMGATLAAMGIIPEIAAIGVIATVVLSGIAGAIAGGVAGYLIDVAINQCCGNVQAKQQATNT